MEESGLLPGLTKFAGDGAYPHSLELFGMLKSFISLFITMPVSGTMTPDPTFVFTVLVMEMAKPLSSIATACEVPGLSGNQLWLLW